MDDLPRLFFPAALRVALLGLGLSMAAMAVANETIFTWIDDDGVQHFSAQPPEDRDYRVVDTLGSGSARAVDEPGDGPAFSPPPRLPEISQTEPDPELLRERCAQAAENLEVLMQEDRPVLLQQDDGEAQPLEGDARRELINETQTFIADWC